MKRFIFRFSFFIFPIITLCWLAESFVTSNLRKSKKGDFAAWNDLFNRKVDADVIIYGSSRAWVHIDPKIFEDSLNLTAYNLGMDGYNFSMEYVRHRLLMKYNIKPRLIVISIGTALLEKRSDLYNLEQFLPYVKDEYVRKELEKYNGLDYIDFEFPFVRYVGSRKMIGRAFMIWRNPQSNLPDRYKGFKSNDRSWEEGANSHKLSSYRSRVDSTSVALFDQFLLETKENGINLIFVNTPQYVDGQKRLINRPEVLGIFNNFSKKYDIPFYDYSNDTISRNKDFFYNSNHMNKNGVDLFNKKFVSQLKRDLVKF